MGDSQLLGDHPVIEEFFDLVPGQPGLAEEGLGLGLREVRDGVAITK